MTLEEILELDAKRTQGEWGISRGDPTMSGIRYYVAIKRGNGYGLVPADFDNANYMSKAPAMVELLKQQAARIKELESIMALSGHPKEE